MLTRKQIQKGLRAAARRAENWNTKYSCRSSWREKERGCIDINDIDWKSWSSG